MTPDNIFQICNTIAPVGWLLLLVAPRWQLTNKIVVSGVFPLLLGIVYLSLIVLYFKDAEGNFSSLDGVMQLFKNPFVVVAGWVHYLAFDLFIGAWELSNSQKLGIPHIWIVPCLVLTFLFGPIGLLLYFLIRALLTRKLIHDNY